MVTRIEFVQAIRDFKRKYGGKLKALLNEGTNPAAVADFWSNPVIHAYLTRASMTFVDKHPDLSDSVTKEEHEVTDHYELKVYKYLPDAVFYRNHEITSSAFYNCGTPSNYELFGKLLRAMNTGSRDIMVSEPSDIYQIAGMATRMFQDPEVAFFPRFLFNMNWQEQHSTALLTILEPLTGRALVTLFMNSWRGKKNRWGFDQYAYNKERFLMAQTSSLQWNSNALAEDVNTKFMQSYLHKIFAINIEDDALAQQPATLLINRDEKAIFTINYTCRDLCTPEYSDIEESPDIETIYAFKMRTLKDQKVPMVSITHKPKIPFIDVSHHVQVVEGDLNCTLYSMNFIQAMVEMLKQPDIAERVYTLAQVAGRDSDAEADLVHIFRENLKTLLPCYYTNERRPKAYAELEAFHLNQRWQLGGRSLSIFHPIATEADTDAEVSVTANMAL